MLGSGWHSEAPDIAYPAGVKLADLNSRAGYFGPELGFARRISELLNFDELWLIKYAVGGSSMLAWDADWSAARAAKADDAEKGPLYSRLIRHAQRVRDEHDLDIRACLWMQGESDARYRNCAKHYGSNLTKLVNSLRHDLKQPQMAFILGLIDPPAQRFPWREQVRQAQITLASELPGSHLVDTNGLSKLDDELHYDTAGQIELGSRFADAFVHQLRSTTA